MEGKTKKYLTIWMIIEATKGIIELIEIYMGYRSFGEKMIGPMMIFCSVLFCIYMGLLMTLYKKKEWARRLVLILIDIQIIYGLIGCISMIAQNKIIGMMMGMKVIYYVGVELILKSKKMRAYFKVD